MFRPFRKSISRITMLLTSPKVAPVKLDSGSTTTTDGFGVVDLAMHRREVELEPVQRRAGGVDPQQALLHPAVEIQADRSHVAHVLRRRLLELKAERALAATAGRIDEVRRQASSWPCRRRPTSARCWPRK